MTDSIFTQASKSSAQNADLLADRYAWLAVILFVLLSLLIEGTTKQMEIARSGATFPGGAAAEWLFEISSHLAIIAMAWVVPLWLYRYPLSLRNWRRRLPNYLAAFILFSVGHILLMVAIRKVVWPMIAAGQYEFGLLTFEPWAYEMRKDMFSFVLVLSTFVTSRHISALNEERGAARADAKVTGQLRLKSGGRQIIVPAEDVISASAAGNYVDLRTQTGHHFVRLTLSELYAVLNDAGVDPVRLHRSHLTVRAHLREIGASDVSLSTGERLPLGRSYRAALRG